MAASCVSPSREETSENMYLKTKIDSSTSIEIHPDSSDKSEEVCEFYRIGKCRFGDKCRKAHSEDEQTSKTKKKVKQKKKIVPEDVIVKKKPAMKTAGDVRNRILWDPSVPAEYFSLGYVDRFAGLVERPFVDFVWGELCDAGPDDLAIPQHCMSYFKYKGHKVWDKETRMDHVFGSAGGGVKIQHKMAEIDEIIAKKLAEKCSDDEDSDDDEIFQPLTTCTRGIENFIFEDTVLRASHFLCVKVKNETLKTKASEVQEHVIMADPALRSCIMPTELFHVTLTMIRCATMSAVVKVNNLLLELQPIIQKMAEEKSQRDIKASGLSTFGSRVLYVTLEVPDAFRKTVEIIQDRIRTMEDVTVTNNFNFVPHLTLLKVNRPTERERRSKYMNSDLYSDYLYKDFGVISFDNIHFCSIDENRGYDRFYQTASHVEF